MSPSTTVPMLCVCLLAAGLVGCNGGTTPSPQPPATPSPLPRPTSASPVDVPGDDDAPGDDFDEDFAQRILERGARKVVNCPATAGARAEAGRVQVVFDGAKGRVVDVVLEHPFSEDADAARQCIKNAWIGEIIPPFHGKRTVPFDVDLDASHRKDDAGSAEKMPGAPGE